MSMKRVRLLPVGIFLVLIFFKVACAGDLESEILGKWNDEENNITMEFFKNYTCSITQNINDQANDQVNTSTAIYTILDDKHIQLVSLGNRKVLEISISEDDLNVKTPGGESVSFKRVK